MAEVYGTPVTPMPEPPKKSNTGLIIAIIVVVLLCCCCVVGGAGWWLWNNGDRLLEDLNTGLIPLFLLF